MFDNLLKTIHDKIDKAGGHYLITDIYYQHNRTIHKFPLEWEYAYCFSYIVSERNVTLSRDQLTTSMKVCEDVHDFNIIASLIIDILGVPSAVAALIAVTTLKRTPSTVNMMCLVIGNLLVVLLNTDYCVIPGETYDIFRTSLMMFCYNLIVLVSFERVLALKYPLVRRHHVTMYTNTIGVLVCAFYCVIAFATCTVLYYHSRLSKADRTMILVTFTFGPQAPLLLIFNIILIVNLKAVVLEVNERFASSTCRIHGMDEGIIYSTVFSTFLFFFLNGPYVYIHFVEYFSTKEKLAELNFRCTVYTMQNIAKQSMIIFHISTFYTYIMFTKRVRHNLFDICMASCFGKLFRSASQKPLAAPTGFPSDVTIPEIRLPNPPELGNDQSYQRRYEEQNNAQEAMELPVHKLQVLQTPSNQKTVSPITSQRSSALAL